MPHNNVVTSPTCTKLCILVVRKFIILILILNQLVSSQNASIIVCILLDLATMHMYLLDVQFQLHTLQVRTNTKLNSSLVLRMLLSPIFNHSQYSIAKT